MERAGRVDQDESVRAEAREEVDLVHQRRVDDDQAVRGQHRLPGPDLPIVQPAVGDDRCAHPLRPEAREGLRVPAVGERGQRKQFGGSDGALAAAPVEAHFEHRSRVPRAQRG